MNATHSDVFSTARPKLSPHKKIDMCVFLERETFFNWEHNRHVKSRLEVA